MIEKQKIRDFLAKSAGVDTEIIVYSQNAASTRFSNNSITQNVTNENVNFTLRVLEDKKTSAVSSDDLSIENLKKIRKKALEIIKFVKEDKDLLPLLDKHDELIVDYALDRETAEIDPSMMAEIVNMCVGEAKKKGMQAAGFLINGESGIVIATTKGMWRENRRSNFSLSLSVMNDEGSGWASYSSSKFDQKSIDEVIKTAIDKADASRNLQTLPPGPYTVILEPAAVADLVAFLGYGGFGGLSFVENRSFMSGKIGKKIMDEKITITDDVNDELFKACPFDFEGLTTKKVVLIENGIAKAVVHDRKTAAIAGTESTGHSLPQPNSYGPFPRALKVSKGSSKIEDMIKSTDKGILVTRFHYTNMIDPMKVTVTGMTRDGLFLVEGGKVTKALKNFRFTESVLDAFSRVVMVGDNYKLTQGFFGGGFVTPALKIENFHFSSNADF